MHCNLPHSNFPFLPCLYPGQTFLPYLDNSPPSHHKLLKPHLEAPRQAACNLVTVLQQLVVWSVQCATESDQPSLLPRVVDKSVALAHSDHTLAGASDACYNSLQNYTDCKILEGRDMRGRGLRAVAYLGATE